MKPSQRPPEADRDPRPFRNTFKLHKEKLLLALNADVPAGIRVVDIEPTSRATNLERVALGIMFDVRIESDEPLTPDFIEDALAWGRP